MGRAAVVFAIVVLMSLSPILAAEPSLRVAASFTEAAHLGEFWRLRILGSGEATLDISSINGRSTKRFKVTSDQLAAIERVVQDQRFFHLSQSLGTYPAPLHQPELWLAIRLGKRSALVHLYNPATSQDASAQRFLQVWRKVFSVAPRQPSW